MAIFPPAVHIQRLEIDFCILFSFYHNGLLIALFISAKRTIKLGLILFVPYKGFVKQSLCREPFLFYMQSPGNPPIAITAALAAGGLLGLACRQTHFIGLCLQLRPNPSFALGFGLIHIGSFLIRK